MIGQAQEIKSSSKNVDHAVVKDFGDEWLSMDQSALTESETYLHFNAYFADFPWESLPKNAVGFDAGCGTGRWAKVVAERVGELHCVEPSAAITVAKRNLSKFDNCKFHNTTIDAMEFDANSMDFGYSLGVLHHMPDTLQGMKDCVKKLKPGAPLLVYLYYAFDNQPRWFRKVWKASDLIRKLICKMPHGLKKLTCNVIATLVYFPLARSSHIAKKFGVNVKSWPLSVYGDRSFYSMRTDALDRFGTKLESRFTQKEITAMMEASGLKDIIISKSAPYYCAVGIKK